MNLRDIGVTRVDFIGNEEVYVFGDRGEIRVTRWVDGRIARFSYPGLPREGHALSLMLRGNPVTPYVEHDYPTITA